MILIRTAMGSTATTSSRILTAGSCSTDTSTSTTRDSLFAARFFRAVQSFQRARSLVCLRFPIKAKVGHKLSANDDPGNTAQVHSGIGNGRSDPKPEAGFIVTLYFQC